MGIVELVHDCDVERRDDPEAAEGDFRESHLWLDNPDTNYGDVDDMMCGTNAEGKEVGVETRGIILFDLTKFLPADADIVSAVWWFNTRSNSGSPGMEWWAGRCGRTDWVEMEATWNVYSTGNGWGSGLQGGDLQGTPAPISLGYINAPGWYDKDITALATYAWDNLDGLMSFLCYRDDEDMDETGMCFIITKDARWNWPSSVHHLRVTYELDGETFQAFVH